MIHSRRRLAAVEWVVLIAAGTLWGLIFWVDRLRATDGLWRLLYTLALLVLGAVVVYGLALLLRSRRRRRQADIDTGERDEAPRRRFRPVSQSQLLFTTFALGLSLTVVVVAGTAAGEGKVSPLSPGSEPLWVDAGGSQVAAGGLLAVGGLALLVWGFRGRQPLAAAGGVLVSLSGLLVGSAELTVRLPDLEVSVDPTILLGTSGARLELLGATAPFESGAAAMRSCEEIILPGRTLRRDDLRGLVVVGHADQRPFRGLDGGGVQSNRQLAETRARWVADCIAEQLPVRLLVTAAAGPLNLGDGLGEAALAEDRRVTLYGLIAEEPLRDRGVRLPVVRASTSGESRLIADRDPPVATGGADPTPR